eukprot:maker-scaffold1129_size60621-snap-gene-0.12 protein:Tk11842 transcript:maker-scaffold1129_size60621-snap-gene-0.12-mRNA-1 annotation:"n-terminal asparagine amidohydrolase"
MVIQVRGRTLESIPDTLDEFFDGTPEIGMANLLLTEIEHTQMWRDEVLFIHQRQQATSDYRENTRVRWIGSHAALTCHICLMRHKISGVGSIGHFDNYCCWQFGEESSAHRDGIELMLDEIAYLSNGDVDDGLVEVTITGGYEDERGDAAKNSMSLLRALHEDARLVELRHFCVGPYNTTAASEEKVGPHLRLGPKTAILKGMALDLKSQIIFPAIFDWGQLSDFQTQIQDIARIKSGLPPLDTEDAHKTADSTFKPKSLRNRAKEKMDRLKKEEKRQMELEKKRSHQINADGPMTNVRLKPTGINENGRKPFKSKFIDFQALRHESTKTIMIVYN